MYIIYDTYAVSMSMYCTSYSSLPEPSICLSKFACQTLKSDTTSKSITYIIYEYWVVYINRHILVFLKFMFYLHIFFVVIGPFLAVHQPQKTAAGVGRCTTRWMLYLLRVLQQRSHEGHPQDTLWYLGDFDGMLMIFFWGWVAHDWWLSYHFFSMDSSGRSVWWSKKLREVDTYCL